MKYKIKYNYTYFILPFYIKKDKYNKYLKSLINDPNFEITTFNKAKNLDYYTVFNDDFINQIFNTEPLVDKTNKEKFNILKNKNACFFEYITKKDFQGKIETEKASDTIYFNMQRISIVCFKTGVCFLIIKANADSNNLDDVLDFNYKFKEIISEYENLKKFQTIKIQNTKYSNAKELKNFIAKITKTNVNNIKKHTDMGLFYTFSYTCVDNTVWNETTEPNILTNLLHKYMKVYSSAYNSLVEHPNTDIVTEFKYRKIGLTKVSSNLLCSGVDPYNFGYLPVEYQSVYLLTYLTLLYFKTYLSILNKRIRTASYKELLEIRKEFNDFTNTFWTNQITLSERLSKYFNSAKIALELDETYNLIRDKLSVNYENLQVEKNNKYYITMIVFLFIILVIQIIFLLFGKQ